MARLKRIGTKDKEEMLAEGPYCKAMFFGEDGNDEMAIVGEAPEIGCCFLVGDSPVPRNKEGKFWMTTPVVDVLSEEVDSEGNVTYSKFLTKSGSVYEFFRD